MRNAIVLVGMLSAGGIVSAATTVRDTAAPAVETLVRFDGGVGVLPVASVAGAQTAPGVFESVTQNVVRGVAPAGTPWTIASFKASIDVQGHIVATGRGLVLAGGNRVGQAPQLRVGATLVCEAAAPFNLHSTLETVPLDGNGDFHIDDALDTVPAECASPVLLIRSSGNGPWLAAGIVRPAIVE